MNGFRRRALFIAAGAILLFVLRRPLLLTARVLLLAGALVFFALPLARRLGKRFPPGLSAALSVASLLAGAAAAALLIAPALVSQISALLKRLPALLESLAPRLEALGLRLGAAGWSAPDLSGMDLSALRGELGGVIFGTASFAGDFAGGAVNFGIAVMLAVYFLSDWDGVRLYLEWLLPRRARPVALRIAFELNRALRLYLGGQLLISLLVGLLSAAGLFLAGVPSPLAFGMLVGLFNVIPYFGPWIGGAPAVLAALSKGLIPALSAISALFIVQQLDGLLIAPRLTGAFTGLHPALVLIALLFGGAAGGVGGMLLAVPLAIVGKISLRVWASRHETIEKSP